jgi:hypothetical protein
MNVIGCEDKIRNAILDKLIDKSFIRMIKSFV